MVSRDMKKLAPNLAMFSLCLLLAGCSFLSPGKKEFFQKEVPVFPVKPEQQIEQEKRSLQYAQYKLDVAFVEGLKSNVSTNVMEPLTSAKIALDPAVESIGHPNTPLSQKELDRSVTSTNLATKLNQQQARQDKALNKLEDKLDDLQGKKIEGTGLIQLSYFSFIAIVFAFCFLLWIGLKIYAIFNPLVAVGTKAVSMTGAAAKKGFSELIKGGEAFKQLVQDKIDDPETKKEVIELFRTAHLTAQDTSTKNIVKDLTN